jgi:hypothetical protein
MIGDKLLKFPAHNIIIKDGEAMSGDNWSLKLNEGWQIVKNKRDYYIIKNVK